MFVHFFMTIWRAMIDASSYVTEFAAKRTSSGILYLYFLCTTLAFFTLLPLAIGLAVVSPSARTFAEDQLTVVQNWYPDELVLTISGGVLTTNQPNPVILDIPAEWDGGTRNMGEPAHAVVIDTDASIDDFGSYGTYVLMTRTALVAQSDREIRVYPFSDMDSTEPMVIDEDLVTEMTTALRGFTPMLPWILVLCAFLLVTILPWVGGFFSWLGTMFFLLWASFLLLIVSGAMGRGLRYGQLYRLGCYGVTSSMILSFAFGMLGLGGMWLLTYAVFFAWMIFVLSRFPQGSATVMRAPAPPAATMKRPPAPRKPRSK